MKLITLNTWGGRALYPLMSFLSKYKNQTDIFCLQEVRNSTQEVTDARHPDQNLYGPLFDKISRELHEFNCSFATFPEDLHKMSLASFWKPSVKITPDSFVVYTPERPQEIGNAVFSARRLQHMKIETEKKSLLIAHYHGLWNNGPKTDTPERIEQSQKIKQFLNQYQGSKIICGDFNLLPETESLRILEEGMRNLVKDYQVQSTRTPLYRHFHNPAEPNFADYILVSPEIVPKKFEVLPDIASDHAALFLEFELE